MPTKRHHYVSRFYLEAFATPESSEEQPMLWRFEHGAQEPILLQPQDAAVQTHYYSIKLASGEKTDVFEKFLSAIEGSATSVLREQIDKEESVLGKAEREKLALYIVIAMLRVPRARNWVEKTHKDLTELIMKTAARVPGRLESLLAELEEKSGEKSNTTADQLREFVLKDRYRLEVNPIVSLQTIFELAPQLHPILYFFQWQVLRTESDDKFLTSDNPVVYVDPTLPRGFWGVGLMNQGLELTFPISPEKCLLATHDPEFDNLIAKLPPEVALRRTSTYEPKMRYSTTPPLFVREINRRTVRAATRYVFSSTNLPALRRFIEKHFPVAPASDNR